MTDEALLSTMVGTATVQANLDRAVQRGVIRHHDDGRFEVVKASDPSRLSSFFTFMSKEAPPPCTFLNRFLFMQAYAQAAVPFGYRNCFKVKIVSRSLRQMMAVKTIAQSFPCASKKAASSPPQDRKMRDSLRLMKIIATAYRIGDETYKDFTGGKSLRPPTVTYSPEPGPEEHVDG